MMFLFVIFLVAIANVLFLLLVYSFARFFVTFIFYIVYGKTVDWNRGMSRLVSFFVDLLFWIIPNYTALALWENFTGYGMNTISGSILFLKFALASVLCLILFLLLIVAFWFPLLLLPDGSLLKNGQTATALSSFTMYQVYKYIYSFIINLHFFNL